ncbi:MAG: hypothetical protein AAF321_11655 [Pseudomonadota bacterium]
MRNITSNDRLLAVTLAATLGLLALGGSAFAQDRRGGPDGRGAMQILRSFDADGDDALTQAEIDAGIAAQVAAADADGDGALSLTEFGTVWDELTERQRVRAFQRLDPNGDASVTTAELEERFGGIVERMDRNEDGQLDRSDRRRGGRDGGRRGRDRGEERRGDEQRGGDRRGG